MESSSRRCAFTLMMSLTLAACSRAESPPTGSKSSKIVGWNPLTCPTSNPSIYPFEISIDKWQNKKLEALTHYANHTNRPWYLLANQNVASVGYRFVSPFAVEAGWDHLDIFYWAPGGYAYNRYSGLSSGDPAYPPLNQFVTVPALGGGHSPAYLIFSWFADDVYNFEGYKIDALKLNCRTDQGQPPVNDLQIYQNYPYTGYLLGTNDVIYLKVVQPAGYAMTLNLWPLDAGTDFDLAASTSVTLPSTQVGGYDWIGERGGTQPELVKIPAFGSIGGQARWIYIAIGSYSGMGQFRFYANVRSFYNSTRSASTDWNPSPPVRAYIKRILHKMSIATYLATEGRFLIDHWDVHWNQPGLWVTFPFQRSQTGASQCDRSGSNPGSTCWTSNDGIVQLNTQNWCNQSSLNCVPVDTPSCPCNGSEAQAELNAVAPLLHEFGHCDWPFGLRDEYLSYNQCGHSLMADEWKGYDANTTDFCNYYNGGEDAPVGHSKEENNWACFASRLYLGNPVVPPVDTAITPDAFYRLGGALSADFGDAIIISESEPYP